MLLIIGLVRISPAILKADFLAQQWRNMRKCWVVWYWMLYIEYVRQFMNITGQALLQIFVKLGLVLVRFGTICRDRGLGSIIDLTYVYLQWRSESLGVQNEHPSWLLSGRQYVSAAPMRYPLKSFFTSLPNIT